jgi:hypothetical protein
VSVLPSPVPHPLDYCPWDLPGWAYEALEWVVGFQWPDGNEAETWDVADRWYALAQTLAGPRDEAHQAAGQIISGYGGSGVTVEAFMAAWAKVSDDENAPLNALLSISHELGKLVEECGCDIEGAKIEAWIELGIFVIELIGMAVAVALTLGAASPAAGGLIAATRIAIQQIFKKLIAQLSRKAVKQSLKEAGERAAKQLTTKAGLRNLGRDALREGFDEAREEFATNAAIQLHQNSTGRRDGLDLHELGMSTAGGFAGGFASAGATIGKGNGHGGLLRGAGGEVLGELGGAAVSGQLDLEGLAKSATSGAAGSAVHGVKAGFGDGLSGLQVPSLGAAPLGAAEPTALAGPAGSSSPLSDPSAGSPAASPTAGSPSSGSSSTGPASGSSAGSSGSSAGSSGSFAGSSGSSSGPAQSGSPLLSAPSAPSTSGVDSPEATSTAPPPPASSTPDMSVTADAPVSSAARGDLSLSALAPPGDGPGPAGMRADPAVGSPASPSPATPSTTVVGGAPVTAGNPAGLAQPGPMPAGLAQPGPAAALAQSGPAPTTTPPAAPPPTGHTAPPGLGIASPASTPSVASPPTGNPAPTAAPPPVISSATVAPPRPGWPDVDGQPGGAPGAQPPTQPFRASGDSSDRVPHDVGLPAAMPPGMVPGPDRSAAEADIERQYLRNIAEQRAAYGANRRAEAAQDLRERAERLNRQARDARRAARIARYLRFDRHGADYHEETANMLARDAAATAARAEAVATRAAPMDPVAVDARPQDWHRLNTDVGPLAAGGVGTGERSVLTGNDHPPAADRLRRYGEPLGLRPPLALHQLDLERAVPRDGNGTPVRMADPRARYFQLLNDGGPQADPTRGINCQDCVLSFYETYVHGRPRVSAPRTFDSYVQGETSYVQGGERVGPERVELVTSGRFQSLCDNVAGEHPAVAQQRVSAAFADITAQLRAGGPGSFAFIVNAWEGGAAHAWAAVNQGGQILFVDPQSGVVGGPSLYGHRGFPHPDNVVQVDALVVDGQGVPMTFPGRNDGAWHVENRTLPPLPPRPTPVYYSATYQQPPEPGPLPTPAPDLAFHPSPDLAAPAPDDAADPPPPPTPAPRPAPDLGVADPPSDPLPAPGPAPDVALESALDSSPEPAPDLAAVPSPVLSADHGSAVAPPAPRTPADDSAADMDPRLARANRIAEALSGGLPRRRPPAPPRTGFDPDAAARAAYFGYAAHARRTHEENRRDEYADYLAANADVRRANAVQLGDQAHAAERDGLTLRAERYRTSAREAGEEAIELTDRAGQVRTGEVVPERVDVEGADWRRINDDVGDLARGAVATDDNSALTGDDFPPPVDRSRRYGVRGGLRPPLAVHQTDLERAMPRDGDGRVQRLADPRTGEWFALANDGGPEADPTRGINCLDGVLSLFDTYVHGRPRVSAPRTFDAYAHGDPTRPLGAEEGGLARIQDAVRGEFQGMCPYVGGLDPEQAGQAVDTAMTNLSNHLHNVGHGAFAFIVTDSEGGSAHAWAAVNHHGSILFLDPQTRRISEEAPLYRHHGKPDDGNVVSMDALVVDGRGEWSSVPYHEAGLWSRTALEPTGTDADGADEAGLRPSADGRGQAGPPGPSDPETPGSEGERAPEGVEVRPGDGGSVPLQRSGQAEEVRPSDSGADLAGGVGEGAAERGEAGGDSRGHGANGLEDGSAPSVATPESDTAKTPAQLEEERLLQTLSSTERATLDAALAEAEDVAERSWRDMREVAASVGYPDDEVQPVVKDAENRVKTLPSLARKFKEREATGGISLREFLGQVNDRVRFTIVVGEKGYGETVRDALRQLEERGYSVHEVASFWGDGRGRHNGLNVTLIGPDTFRIELQFPTPASRGVGKQTHKLYEDVRLESMSARKRVEAFLAILRMNKRAGMASRQPQGLDRLPRFVPVDTSFVTWTRGKGVFPWAAYRESLVRENKHFSDVLREFDLAPSDIPGFERLGLPDEPPASGIPRLQSEGSGPGNEPGGLHDRPGGTAPGGDVARQPEGVDVRPGIGGSPAVRRHIPGPVDGSRPDDGGAPGSGVPADGASDRGNDPGDVRGGGQERLDVRPSAELTPDQPEARSGEAVQVDDAVVVINELTGQTLGPLGPEFRRGVHYPELLEHEHEVDQAEHAGQEFDLRALDALHGRTDGLGNPDVIIRIDDSDAGAYADLKRLFPQEQPTAKDPDFSRRVEKRLRDAFSQDRRITVALVDGRDIGLTIDGAVRGIRRALGFWRQTGREVGPEQRMIVVTGDGTFVTWRGDTGAINVSA